MVLTSVTPKNTLFLKKKKRCLALSPRSVNLLIVSFLALSISELLFFTSFILRSFMLINHSQSSRAAIVGLLSLCSIHVTHLLMKIKLIKLRMYSFAP